MSLKGPEPRWLSARDTADYICVRVDSLARLVKQGHIPAPSYGIGPRQPRWDRLALDACFTGQTAQANAEAVMAEVARSIRDAPRRRHVAGRDQPNRDDAG